MKLYKDVAAILWGWQVPDSACILNALATWPHCSCVLSLAEWCSRTRVDSRLHPGDWWVAAAEPRIVLHSSRSMAA
jgi:hypothetical protein